MISGVSGSSGSVLIKIRKISLISHFFHFFSLFSRFLTNLFSPNIQFKILLWLSYSKISVVLKRLTLNGACMHVCDDGIRPGTHTIGE